MSSAIISVIPVIFHLISSLRSSFLILFSFNAPEQIRNLVFSSLLAFNSSPLLEKVNFECVFLAFKISSLTKLFTVSPAKNNSTLRSIAAATALIESA